MTKRFIPLRKKVSPVLRKYHVRTCAVFGSFARGEETKKSDIDFLIDPSSSMTLFDLVGLQQDLEDATGRDVDVVTRRSLHPLIKANILRDAMMIYEA